MRTVLAILVAGTLLAACGQSSPPPGPVRVAGACGTTRIARGSVPAWTAPAFADSSPGPPRWPHALSVRRDVTAILFSYPLRAGNPTGRRNKILWIVKQPRNGSPLRIVARPLNSARPVVRLAFPASSSPGEIYPSYVDVPTAGCWRLTLRWAGHVDRIALRYLRTTV